MNATDNDNAPLIVSIKPNGNGIYELENVDFNFITSIYGKDSNFENFITRAVKPGNLLYWDKNKSQELFSCQGLQLPEAINNLDSNIIIHQSRNIVKGSEEKNSEEMTAEVKADKIHNSFEFNPLRRLYNLQDIKIESLKHIEFKDNPLARSVFNDSKVSISQLFQIVKYSDKDFYVNKSQGLDENRATYSTTPTESNQNAPQNFRITEDSDIETGGSKAKFAANIAAIQTLKAIESENRAATPEEQAVLAKYAGWGGLPQAFNPTNEQWSKEYKQLRELLTDEEYNAAAESTLNAHYTSPEVINAMYKALENFGFKGGNLLEPALGTGRFFGCMPEKCRTAAFTVWSLTVLRDVSHSSFTHKRIFRLAALKKQSFPIISLTQPSEMCRSEITELQTGGMTRSISLFTIISLRKRSIKSLQTVL